MKRLVKECKFDMLNRICDSEYHGLKNLLNWLLLDNNNVYIQKVIYSILRDIMNVKVALIDHL